MLQYRRSALPILVAVCAFGCASDDAGTDLDDPNADAPMAPSAAGAANGSGNTTPAPTRPGGSATESPSVAPVSNQGSQSAQNSGSGRGGAAGMSDGPSASDDEEDEDAPNAGTGGAGNAPGSGGSPANGGSSAAPPGSDGVPSFAADVLPILRADCGSCHGSGFLPRFAASNVDAAYTVAVDLSTEIVQRIEQGTMPPACGRGDPGDTGCVSEDDFETIQSWVEGDTPE